MRHEQEYDNTHDRDRYNEERRNQRRPPHNQDASNRWGEPDPRMNPNDDQGRHPENRNQPNRSDWKPFEQRDNRHFQEDERRYGNYGNERPDWQQHDQRNRPGNQHPDDRWSSGREMPHPHQQHHHPRHASEKFYREQRRRNW
ncbi:hypothetical protein WG947_12470 [Pontibacter sp. H259]|uniref:hypothetical protein n=1 Tax=Pontibacter sp. H259 TaxID=3133421 RepID=UPI0030BBFABE